MLEELRSEVLNGRCEEARVVFLKALQDETLADRDLAETYHLMSVAEFGAGHTSLAHTWAKAAETYATKAGDSNLFGRILFNLVEYQRLTGNALEALENGRRWLEMLDQFPQLRYRRGVMLYNLGLVHRQRNDTQTAISHYQEAIRDLGTASREYGSSPEGETARQFLIKACQNCAWLLYGIGQITEGDAYGEQSRSLLNESDTAAAREQRLLGAYRKYHVGEYHAALESAAESLAPGIPATPQQRFWAYWVCGMAAARLDQMEAASAFAVIAIDEANRTGDGHLTSLGHALKLHTANKPN